MRNKAEDARNRARNLRNNQSVAEKWMWNAIRKDKLGFHFRRQFPIGSYTLDFYCPEAKLCVEMDSDLHDPDHDAKRDDALKMQGILTIRIPNVDYLALKGSPSRDWLGHIQQTCEERTGRPAF
jgi:very-short-patch-repair endonuclease